MKTYIYITNIFRYNVHMEALISDPKIADFLNAIELSSVSENSKYRYRKVIERAFAAKVDLLSADSVAVFADTLPNSVRSQFKAAINVYYKALRHRMDANATPEMENAIAATNRRLNALSASIQVKAPKGKRSKNWLSPDEMRQLVGTCDLDTVAGLRDAALLALLYGCGMRRDEASRSKWGDIVKQGERHIMNIEGKGAKTRSVPIAEAVYKTLIAWKHIQSKNCKDVDFILTGVNKSGVVSCNGMSSQSVYKIVGRLGVASGFDIRPHDLRRTFAQTLRNDGVLLETISALLGHSNIETTKRYLDIVSADADTSSVDVAFG